MKRKGAHKGIFGQLIKIFGKAKVEEISEKTGIDEYSEKLTLEQHALIMIWHAISDCERLRELCRSLRGVHKMEIRTFRERVLLFYRKNRRRNKDNC